MTPATYCPTCGRGVSKQAPWNFTLMNQIGTCNPRIAAGKALEQRIREIYFNFLDKIQ